MAESIRTYAQPLLDATDGSIEQMNHALEVGLLCWNLALLPENERNAALLEMQPKLEMQDDEFESFRRTIVLPMIRRHHEMFPSMHGAGLTGPSKGTSVLRPPAPPPVVPKEQYIKIGRNDPCPCNSGKKYKRCCGR